MKCTFHRFVLSAVSLLGAAIPVLAYRSVQVEFKDHQKSSIL